MARTCTKCEQPVVGGHNARTCGKSQRGSAPNGGNPLSVNRAPIDGSQHATSQPNSVEGARKRFEEIPAEQRKANDPTSFGGHSYRSAQEVAAIGNDNVCKFKGETVYPGGMEDYQGEATADLIAAEENPDPQAAGPVFYGIRPRTGLLVKIVPYGFVDTKDSFDNPVTKYKVRVIPGVDNSRADGKVDFPLHDENGKPTSWTGRVPTDFGLQVDWDNSVNSDSVERW